MSRVRALSDDHDFLFGKGQNDYMRDVNAVMQNINTRLSSFLGDCFFDNGAGLDWLNLLGAKNQTALNLAISAMILNTANVTGLQQLLVTLSPERALTVQYIVQTSYGRAAATFQLDPNAV